VIRVKELERRGKVSKAMHCREWKPRKREKKKNLGETEEIRGDQLTKERGGGEGCIGRDKTKFWGEFLTGGESIQT